MGIDSQETIPTWPDRSRAFIMCSSSWNMGWQQSWCCLVAVGSKHCTVAVAVACACCSLLAASLHKHLLLPIHACCQQWESWQLHLLDPWDPITSALPRGNGHRSAPAAVCLNRWPLSRILLPCIHKPFPHLPLSPWTQPHPSPYVSPPCRAPVPTQPLAATTPSSLTFALKPHTPPCVLLSATPARCQHLLDHSQQPHHLPSFRTQTSPCILHPSPATPCWPARRLHLLDGWQQPHANGRHAGVALRAAAPPSYLHRAQEGHGPAT